MQGWACKESSACEAVHTPVLPRDLASPGDTRRSRPRATSAHRPRPCVEVVDRGGVCSGRSDSDRAGARFWGQAVHGLAATEKPGSAEPYGGFL